MPPHPLTDFEIQKYYQNKPRFTGVYSGDNLPERSSTECNSVEIKNEAHVIILDEYSDIRTHWIAFYVLNNNVTYFDSFGVEHIPKEIKINDCNKYFQNTSIRFNNVRIFLHWIY